MASPDQRAEGSGPEGFGLAWPEADIQPSPERAEAIPGILGLLIIRGDRLGLAGDITPLIEHQDPQLTDKITRNPRSGRVF